MNLLLFTDSDRLGENRITVQDHRLQHLLQVHRAKVGDQVRVGELGGLMGEGHILELSDKRAVLALALSLHPPAKLPLSLIIALPRPKMLRRILRSMAEFGAAELHLINSYRVEKSYWQTPVLQAATIHEYLLQGLAQSRDTMLPQIHCHPRFKPFVEDLLPAMTEDRCALLAHPGDYPPCPREVRGETVVVIGPEGGFIPYEVEKLQEAGCEAVSLGPRILRVENALTSLLGRLF
ncbi:MAG: 16S rRNA (uracil(1498)-N(3))-methyltransferase [Gammaproteobacteria bacterium]|nr:MAG: 16S rRNA (uracil(1498)-N(3))-methyltransferase [Gammaproteobacteria bacterium]